MVSHTANLDGKKSWSNFDVQGQLSALDPVDKLLLVSISAVILLIPNWTKQLHVFHVASMTRQLLGTSLPAKYIVPC
ncbi:hypothetical protein VNO80_22589 [Phaseolus coccineus]|uniref:Uncharacterized protein n=1 Tax=Phaseolus coccineus TaxID=3886 RepID=A0AAN9M4F0_PHACN